MSQQNRWVRWVGQYFSDVVRPENRTRLIAAVLYLIAALFFGGIVFILASTWGEEGLSLLLAAKSPARFAVIYLLIAGAFSAAVSMLLFSRAPLSPQLRRRALIAAGALMLIGILFAAPAVVVSIAPFWFLYRLHRDAEALHRDSPAGVPMDEGSERLLE